uniref:Transmembrane protein n=1 Tax=Lotus japonicus TaxID=34305 RepID=I3SHP8_LOTJA|nr:unknown [Lotus japonicus]
MDGSGKTLRRSIHCFLQNYHYFTSTAAFLAFPFSASILLPQALVPTSSSLLPQIYNHLRILFDAAGFPSSSQLFTRKVSQTITSSIFTLPLTLTFFLIAKASTILALNHHRQNLLPPSFNCLIHHYKPILHTYIHNSFLILSANASSFCLFFLSLTFAEGLGYSSPSCTLFLSAATAVVSSVILATALVICNMALIISGMEGHGGYMAILKACVLLRGNTSKALFLALPGNLALAAIEALFQFRVVRAYHNVGNSINSWPFMALEGIFIAYLYSISIIIDTIVSCMFYKSCNMGSLVDQEDMHFSRIELAEEQNYELGIQELSRTIYLE